MEFSKITEKLTHLCERVTVIEGAIKHQGESITSLQEVDRKVEAAVNQLVIQSALMEQLVGRLNRAANWFLGVVGSFAVLATMAMVFGASALPEMADPSALDKIDMSSPD